MGIARESTTKVPLEPNDVGHVGTEAVVEGTDGRWRVDPDALANVEEFSGRTALLSPFDRLVYDRARAEELFDFEYVPEMHKSKDSAAGATSPFPSSTRTCWWESSTPGPTASTGTPEVYAIHEDVPFTPAIESGMEAELSELAGWLDLALAG